MFAIDIPPSLCHPATRFFSGGRNVGVHGVWPMRRFLRIYRLAIHFKSRQHFSREGAANASNPAAVADGKGSFNSQMTRHRAPARSIVTATVKQTRLWAYSAVRWGAMWVEHTCQDRLDLFALLMSRRVVKQDLDEPYF